MNTSELIALMQECDPDAPVHVWRDGTRHALDSIDELDGTVNLNVEPGDASDYWEAVRGRAVLRAAAETFLDAVGDPELDDTDLDRLTLIFSRALEETCSNF